MVFIKNILDKLEPLIHSIETERSSFLIFALFLREDSLEKWDVIISAPWLNSDELSAYRLIDSKLREVLTESESLQLARIVLLDPDDPVVTFLLNLETVKNGKYKEFSGQDLTEKFKFTIKRAYLLRSLKQSHTTAE